MVRWHPRFNGQWSQDNGVWVNSGSWWWTRKPGVLQSMGSQSQTWLSNWTGLNWGYLGCETVGFNGQHEAEVMGMGISQVKMPQNSLFYGKYLVVFSQINTSHTIGNLCLVSAVLQRLILTDFVKFFALWRGMFSKIFTQIFLKCFSCPVIFYWVICSAN